MSKTSEARLKKYKENKKQYFLKVFENVKIVSGIITGYQHFISPFQVYGGFTGFPQQGNDEMAMNNAMDFMNEMIVRSVIFNGKRRPPLVGRDGCTVYLQGFVNKFNKMPGEKNKIKLEFNKGYFYRVIEYPRGGRNCLAYECYVRWSFK